MFDRFKRLPAKQYQSIKEKGGLTPNMGHGRSRSGYEHNRNDFEILNENNDI